MPSFRQRAAFRLPVRCQGEEQSQAAEASGAPRHEEVAPAYVEGEQIDGNAHPRLSGQRLTQRRQNAAGPH